MKKIFVILGILLAAGVAFAHAPEVQIDPIGPLEYATFPQNYNVTGTITHTNPSNVDAVKDLTLWIDGVIEGAVIESPFDGDSSSSAIFSLPWSIVGPGTYDVKVTAKHGGNQGEDTEEVVVAQAEVVITECPAAPAIAGEYLKNSLDIKPGSTIWKKVIKAVANQTGSKGSLWAANACDSDYPDQVKSFVDGII